jgi:hypothetical protein
MIDIVLNFTLIPLNPHDLIERDKIHIQTILSQGTFFVEYMLIFRSSLSLYVCYLYAK